MDDECEVNAKLKEKGLGFVNIKEVLVDSKLVSNWPNFQN